MEMILRLAEAIDETATRPTISLMLERAQTKALPLLNRGVELTPAVQACCGTCRTCITTNIATLAMAAVTGAAANVARLARRRIS
jgi:hypothetical protein